uniref:Nudix hydrolase domain-containing protein n=1 Tax=Leptobrachium leishanense TaxID=445787 RepID=A0A8C5QM63_9ANUR
MLLRQHFPLRSINTWQPLQSTGNVLSKETEQRCRDVLSRTEVPELASAGVLVTLCSLKGVPSFLYTLRSSQLRGRHKGDVSFPGGKRDATDRNIIYTALREAQEELRVTLTPASAWGAMKPIMDWTGMTIVPVLANIGPLEDLAVAPNPDEVESILTLPISQACTDVCRGYTYFRQRGRYSYTLPVFRLKEYKVWGLTAMMTDSALSLLLPNSYSSILKGSRTQ